MLRIHSLAPAALLGLALSLTGTASAATSAPLGVMVTDLPVGLSGLATPLIADEVALGRIATNSGNTATFETAAGNIGARLTAGGRYYLEIVTGAFEGERLDLDTAATIAAGNASVVLDLSATSHSTTNLLSADVLASARAVVRPHVTLASFAPNFKPALVGNNNFAQADLVRLVSKTGLVQYYLRADGQSWREPGKLVDHRNLVIPPDVSVLVQLRSGAKRWVHTGLVRENAFRKKLINGQQGFATGFPVDMSLVQIGAFVEAAQPANTRWVGSDDPAVADTIKIFDRALNDYRSYHLRADGTSWTRVGDSTNVASSPLLVSPGMITLSRTNPDPTYLIIPPFSSSSL